MSSRMYLYNLHQVPEEVIANTDNSLLASYGHDSDKVTMMMEWKYEYPLLFHPLFTEPVTIAPPKYNGTEGGLYAHAFPGIDALRAFYDFIEKHADQLLDDKAAFQEARFRLRNYFRKKINLEWFHLDAWDVFNMNDDGSEGNHAHQAEELKAAIAENNRIIRAAIAADDPALLDTCPFLAETGWATSFRQLLNESVYDFGWEIIRSGSYKEEELEVFTENSLKGLKDEDDNIVLPAIYDEIYEYPYGTERAVVIHQGKAGYIDKQGKLVIPCIYEDAFDFVGRHGHVVTEGKFAVIDEVGKIIIAPIYEDGFLISPELFAVGNDGQWGIIDPAGKFLLPMQPANSMEAIKDSSSLTYYKLEQPDGTIVWLSHTFHTLISGEVDRMEIIDGYYLMTRGSETGLLDAAGNALLPFDTHQVYYDYNLQAFLVRNSSGKGIFLPPYGWLLPATFQEVKPLENAGPDAQGNRYAIVLDDGNAGLFSIGISSRWTMPMDYKNFVLLKEGFLGVQHKNGYWGMSDYEGHPLSAVDFTSMNGKQGCLTYGVALGFRDKAIYVLTADGSVKRPTAQQIVDELAYYPEAFYNKTEMQALQVAAKESQSALDAHAAGNLALDEGRYADAIIAFENAIKGNCLEAITDLGYLYETAPGYQDPEKAFSLYVQAAGLGEKVAMNNVGLAYLAGRGTDPDTSKAISWLKKAVELYYSGAMVSLADVYFYPEYDIEDYDSALALYLQALDYKEDVAQQIGHIYEQEEEYEDAAIYYQQAADAGHAYSKWRLGCLYADGNGVTQDPEKALELYQGAVGAYPEVHIDIAILYMNEEMFNPKMAQAHLFMAKEQGVSKADEYVEKFKSKW